MNQNSAVYTLYGMAGSLYTGKVRAYLRRRGLPFVEKPAGGEEFKNTIVPKIGRWIIPVIVTPEGELLQDGSDIIDALEERHNASHELGPAVQPKGLMGVLSHLFALFGSEGLLRPAMHYRWNFDDDNLVFLKAAFEDVLPAGLSDEKLDQAFLHSSGRMRKAGRSFGVIPENFTAIEKSYEHFLGLLEAHFKKTPFLLGSYPTLGDYGLLGPLYPHLGRDPYPARLMQRIAPHVFRWVERMNAPEEIADHVASIQGDGLFEDAAIPATLISLLDYIAEDYLPEFKAHSVFTQAWLEHNPAIEAGTNGLADPAARTIGVATFEWRGRNISTAVMPYRFYLQQRIVDAASALNHQETERLRQLLDSVGLMPVVKETLSRRVSRKNFLEVWD